MKLIEELHDAWGWVGMNPAKIVGENDFGNLLIKDADGRFWRLRPEDLSCKIIAKGRRSIRNLALDRDFLRDWKMTPNVTQAKELLGPLGKGKKYCLKIPTVLGGNFDGHNLATIDLVELIKFSGYLALQINEVPDGGQIELMLIK